MKDATHEPIVQEDTKRSTAWKTVIEAEHTLLEAHEEYFRAVEAEAIEGGLSSIEASQVGARQAVGVAATYAVWELLGAFLEEGVDSARISSRALVMRAFAVQVEQVLEHLKAKDALLAASFGADDPKKSMYEVVRQLDEEADVEAFVQVGFIDDDENDDDDDDDDDDD